MGWYIALAFAIGMGIGLLVAEMARDVRDQSNPPPFGFARCPVTGNLYFRGD